MTVVLAFACPRCEYEVGAASALGPDGETITPKPGDLSLCVLCGAPLEFQDGMPPRWLTYDELVDACRHSAEVRGRIAQTILLIVTMRPSRIRSVPGRSAAMPSPIADVQRLCEVVRHILLDREARGPCFVRLATALRDVEVSLGNASPLDPRRFAKSEEDSV